MASRIFDIVSRVLIIALLVCSPGVAGMSAWHTPTSVMIVKVANECCIMELILFFSTLGKGSTMSVMNVGAILVRCCTP